MARRKGAAVLDGARVAAAFLVVAIHTGPLLSYSELGDFILTRVVARLAVPLFLMLSGRFLLGGDPRSRKKRVDGFLKKTLLLYSLATLLYLPLNWYGGYFARENLPLRLAYDALIGGTFYHLWYFPAVMLGVVIVRLLLDKTTPAAALCVTGALYLVGLGGDSYFGLAQQVPPLAAFYDWLLTLFDYTRNGLFFAPLFLLLGAMAARPARRCPTRACAGGFGVCLAAMLAEGLLLHQYGFQRHDSMYLFLPAAAYCLFLLLQGANAGQSTPCRTFSMWVFILHPWCIVAVRALSKLLRADWLMENALVFFLAVCVLSALCAIPFVFLPQKRRTIRKSGAYTAETARAWLEIDLDAIRHNARLLQKRMRPGCRMMAVVKADAYGHGAVPVAHALAQDGIDAFAVATLDEAIELRKSGLRADILILGYTAPSLAAQIRRYNLIQTVCNADYAHRLHQTGQKLRVHLKIDTGMHRLGEDWRHPAQIKAIFDYRNLRIEGCFTHLCAADSHEPAHRAFTEQQASHFYDVIHVLRKAGCDPGKIHLQSSYGLINYPQLDCDYARVGILLYGVHSEPQPADNLGLRPALSLRARVGCVGTVRTGESLGYGCAYLAPADMRYAVVAIGYADGLPRNYAGDGARVLIRGQSAPIIGRICMDQLIVDVTGIPHLAAGDSVTIIGRDQDQVISCEEVAARCATITNEILSRIGKRLRVQYNHN